MNTLQLNEQFDPIFDDIWNEIRDYEYNKTTELTPSRLRALHLMSEVWDKLPESVRAYYTLIDSDNRYTRFYTAHVVQQFDIKQMARYYLANEMLADSDNPQRNRTKSATTMHCYMQSLVKAKNDELEFARAKLEAIKKECNEEFAKEQLAAQEKANSSNQDNKDEQPLELSDFLKRPVSQPEKEPTTKSLIAQMKESSKQEYDELPESSQELRKFLKRK